MNDPRDRYYDKVAKQDARMEALEVYGEFTDACAAFFNRKTKEDAKNMVEKGQKLRELQDFSGTTFRKSSEIRHREMVAQEWLDNNTVSKKEKTSERKLIDWYTEAKKRQSHENGWDALKRFYNID